MAKASIPLIPIAADGVLYPGTLLRIPANRPDIPVLLSSIFGRGSTVSRSQISNYPIGCVPVNSPYLSAEGKDLIDSVKKESTENDQKQPVEPGKAKADDLFRYGTLAKIVGVQGQTEPFLQVEGVQRFRIDKVLHERPYFEAEVTFFEDEIPDLKDTELRNSFSQLKQRSRELLTVLRLASFFRPGATTFSPLLMRRFELFIAKKDISQAGQLADFITDILDSSFEDKLRVLSILDVKQRLEKVLELLNKQVQGINGNIKTISITSTVIPGTGDSNGMDQSRRDALSKRMPFGLSRMPGVPGMPGSGGEEDQEVNEVDELRQKLAAAGLSAEAQKVADRELRRLKKMHPSMAEYGVCRTYLENLAEIPWTKTTEDQLGKETIGRARKQLDDDHYGLEKVKKRLIEYLAVLRMKQVQNAPLEQQIEHVTKQLQSTSSVVDKSKIEDKEEQEEAAPQEDRDALEAKLHILKSKKMIDKAPILLLVGPPGVGKTSLAKSIAMSLGRKFHRISLGGVRDEAEIRGHRRTYVAAMPGLIVSGLKKVGVANPVFLLDEIDKVGTSNFHGDPSAAMLEVLDPEQNHSFNDHYVNIPIDLSKVLFIATANTLDTIPPPLLDRMETIQLPGYTTIEKRHIAKQHLIPKQIRTNGLADGQVVLPDEVVDMIITAYTRESGVRNLEREIGSVCRSKAVQYAEANDAAQTDKYDPKVTLEQLEDILGIERFEEEIAEKKSRPGVVTGLVAYSSGGQGSILFIEVADMPGDGRVQLTGKLGDVLKESVEVALSWVKAHSYELGLTHNPDENIMQKRSIHVHCPSGAIPKDGPSAGLAHTVALISLFSSKAVPPKIAMTGEVSLRGRVMPVGGIKEKLIGAHRAGVKTVLLPVHNRKDVKDVPEEVKKDLEIVYVQHIYDALRVIWPDSHWATDQHFISHRL